jgi:tetratricopeptide (TPR) repeat protein
VAENPSSVFISYSWNDDKPFVEKLDQDLRGEGITVWRDEKNLPSRGTALREELRNAIDAADRFLPVIGPEALKSQNVQLEWNHARAQCRAIVPILRKGDSSLIPEDWRGTDAPLYFDFRDDSAYAETLGALIGRLKEAPELPGAFKGDAILQPPEGAIPRKEMVTLINLLRPDRTTAAITGRKGVGTAYAPGGLGKSVLAAMFARDCPTRRAFPDGIFWIELGRQPQVVTKQADIGAAFGDDRQEYTDVKAGKARLQQMLVDKRVLFVLDDVWDYRHAAAFIVDAPRCRWLITTRQTNLASRLNLTAENIVKIEYLSEQEGLALITRRLGLTPGKDNLHKDTHSAIVTLLDGHTQAISLSADLLVERGADYAARLLERMQARQEGKNPFDDLILEMEDKEKNLELALSLSYDDLAPDGNRPRPTDNLDLQRRFRALGVFAPGGTFDSMSAAAVWGDDGQDAEQKIAAEDALAALVNAGLLSRTEEGRYTQHSLLRAYAMALLKREGEYENAFDHYTEFVIALAQGFDALPPEEWSVLEPYLPHVDYVGDALVERYEAHSNDADWQQKGLRFARNAKNYVFRRPQVMRIEAGATLRGLDWLEMGLAAAREAGEQKTESLFLNEIGLAWDALGEKRKALDYYEQALELTRAVGNRSGEAATLNNIGLAWFALGEKRKALEHYEQALPLRRAIGDRGGEATMLNNIGLAWDALGEKRKALAYYEQALPVFRAVEERDGEAATLHNIGAAWSALGEKRKSLEYYEQALLLIREVGDRGGEATTLNNIGGVWDALGEKRKALETYEQALLLIREVGDRGGEAATLNNIGGTWSGLGEVRKALETYEQALLLRRAIGDRGGEATTLNNIGLVWSALGEKRKALEYYEQALLLMREVEDRGGEATTLNNIGLVWSALGEVRKALEYYEQALELTRAVGDRGGEATTLNNIGAAWDALGEVHKALAYYEQALPLRRAVGDRGGEATTLNSIGMTWDALGEKRKALAYYEQALPLRRAVEDRGGEAVTLNNIGLAWFALGEKRKALEYYEQALLLIRAVKDRGGEAATCFNIGAIYAQLGDLDRAIEYVERCMKLGEEVEHPNLESDRQFLERLKELKAQGKNTL